MNNTVLLIGGCGFIGTNLAIGFASRGCQVHIYDKLCPDDKRFGEYSNKIEIARGDFSDVEKIRQIIEDTQPSLVVHLVSNTITNKNIESVIDDINEDVLSTVKLLNVIRDRQNLKFVYFSSGGTVYGNNGKRFNEETDPTCPINTYGWTKLCIENLIRMHSFQFGTEYLILRPSNPYGPWQNIYGHQGLVAVTLGKVMNNEEITVWGDGSIIRDYIYIGDLVDAVISLCLHNEYNETYNIGSGTGLSVNSILKAIEQVTNKGLNINYIEGRKTDIATNVLDNKKMLSKLANFKLAAINEGITETWKWINKTIKEK